jgi:hypothetical protein
MAAAAFAGRSAAGHGYEADGTGASFATIMPSAGDEIRDRRKRFSVAMTQQQIALALSAAFFGLVIGFLAGYAVRAYISYLSHRGKV